jgi:hypothetical protein
MKSLAPWFMAIGAAIITITTAIGGARGAFRGTVPFTPYLIGYGFALLAFIIAGILYYAQDETPSVVPVRYDSAPASPRKIDGVWCRADGAPFSTEEILRAKHTLGYHGLLVTNDRDPAYEVHVVSGKIGDSVPTFGNSIQRLSKNDGEGFFPINIQRADGVGVLGGLFEEMRTKNVAALPVTIRHKNGKRHYYKTTRKVVRDVTAIGGLSINDVHHGRDLFRFLRRD